MGLGSSCPSRYRFLMAAFYFLLVLHIGLGTAAMIAGPVSMFSRKRRGRHTTAGEIYHWLVLGTCAGAAALAFLDWSRIWWFLPIAIGSYAFAFVGYLAAKWRWRGWLPFHIIGQGGSYIALVTAVLVVNWLTLFGTRGIHSPLAWVLPTVLGSPIIGFVVARTQRKAKRNGTAA